MEKIKAFGIATPSKKNLLNYELGDEVRFFRSEKAAKNWLDGMKFPTGEVVVPIEIKLK